ncbi:MAG: AAA family ATPase [Anaerolineae bacterium]|nr:AAA family ATPase [Anaerolineae bacterium]
MTPANEPVAGCAAATLPAVLQDYLSPSLWEQLQAEPTRRGLLLDALTALHSFVYLLSTYLPHPLVEALKRDPAPGQIGGECLEGSLLFADVSGFTALSERLAAQGSIGVETLTGHINTYFDAMVQVLARSSGALLKFAGDALLAYFPLQANGRHAQWASRAAQRMMRVMGAFAALETPAGPVALRMKIGLATGPFVAVKAGVPERMEYVVFGETVSRTLALEGTLSAGQIGVDAATAALLAPAQIQPHTGDFFLFALDNAEEHADFEIQVEGQRRGRSSGLLMASHEELHAQITLALRQIQALSAFLSAPLVELLLVHAHQRQLPAENRPAAILFFNLTGIEPLWDSANPHTLPRATQVLNACFNVVQTSVARYGGIISRIDPYKVGSKILAIFGAPVAHEDDPLRAVRAALDARAGLAGLLARWERDSTLAADPACGQDAGIALQAGIAYGPTFAGPVGAAIRREYTLMGDDVNLAARLMGAAQPGQILVAPAVAVSIQAAVKLTALAPLRLKGKRDPVPVFQVESLGHDPLSRRLALRGPLLGREAELGLARAALQKALSGKGSLLSVVGEPGIGKSHFADTLAAEARAQGASVHLSTCAAYALATPYAPWIALIRTLAHLAPELAGEAAARQLLEWLAREGCLAEDISAPLLQLFGLPVLSLGNIPTFGESVNSPVPVRPGLFQRLGAQVAPSPAAPVRASLWQLARERQHVPGGSDTWRQLERRIADRVQTRLFNAMEHLWTALAQKSPRVLIFEDVHWLDAPSRNLLTHLVGALSDYPVLFLITCRPAERAGNTFSAQVISLGPLTPKAVEALVSHLLGADSLSGELLALMPTLMAKTGGNPLFIEELCAWFRRNGVQDLEAGLRHSLTLQELVLSRLDTLSHVEGMAVRAASVVGNDFQVSELAALLHETVPTHLSPALEGLENARFTFAMPQVNVEHGAVAHSFCQTLVREMLYDSQPLVRRRQLHARLAEYLRTNHAADLAAVAEELAYHYLQASAWLEASRFALLAGTKAQSRAAYEAALEHYTAAEQALTHLSGAKNATPEARDLWGRVRVGQGDVAFLQGHFEAAGQAYAAAHPDLQDAPQLLARAVLVRPLLKPGVSMLEMTEDAWNVLESAGTALPAIAAVLAWFHWREGDLQVACRWAERGSPNALMAFIGGDLQKAWGSYQAEKELAGAALVALQLAESQSAQGAAKLWLARATEDWTREDDAWGMVLVQCKQAHLLRLQGDLSAAARIVEEARSSLQLVSAQVFDSETPTVVPDAGDFEVCILGQRRYEDIFHALYLFNLLTPFSPEVQ